MFYIQSSVRTRNFRCVNSVAILSLSIRLKQGNAKYIVEDFAQWKPEWIRLYQINVEWCNRLRFLSKFPVFKRKKILQI